LKYRPFGKTGLNISEVVIGGGYVGGILINPDNGIKREALRRALAAGVNWIDTAPTYGNGQSETNLGWLLPELKKEQQPYLSTKVRLDPSNLSDISGQVEASINASLKKLNRQSVDLLQLHNMISTEVTDRAVTLGYALQAADCFDLLREQGLIKLIGYTALVMVRVVLQQPVQAVLIRLNSITILLTQAPHGVKSVDGMLMISQV
jgi:D-threo-aldose 1-dehydrogenase